MAPWPPLYYTRGAGLSVSEEAHLDPGRGGWPVVDLHHHCDAGHDSGPAPPRLAVFSRRRRLMRLGGSRSIFVV